MRGETGGHAATPRPATPERTVANDRTRTKRLVACMTVLCALVWAASAPAVDLAGGTKLKLVDRDGTGKDLAAVSFIGDAAIVDPLPDPTTEASGVRITSGAGDTGWFGLDGDRWWDAVRARGYRYGDRTGGAVRKVVLKTRNGSGKLILKLRGDGYGASALGGPVIWAEVRLSIGSTVYCGRFELGTSQVRRNEAGTVIMKGPSVACVPQPNPDFETFQLMLAGALNAAEGMLAISRSGGWPVATEGGFVFARLDDGRGAYSLAGDHNGWVPAAMTNEAGLWWTRVPIATPGGRRYKFVTAAGEYEADPFARAYDFDIYGEHSLVRPGATGHLERHLAVTDGVVSPRTVRVWVPAQPVTHQLYAQDGQNLFHPDAPYGGWKLQEKVGASTMVVGIDSNADRIYDYTHTPDVVDTELVGGGGDAYADFVQLYLRPFIEQRYGAAAKVGLMGSSLGGLIAFHIAHRHAGEWAFAGSLSGTFWWGRRQAENESIVERYVSSPPLGTALYLDSGGGPGSGCVDSDGDGLEDDSPDATDNYCVNRQFADLLATVGYEPDVSLWYAWEPDALHNEAAWADRVSLPLARFENP